MTFSRYTLRPHLRAALMTFLVHHNPFYLLSALCMVAACLAPRARALTKQERFRRAQMGRTTYRIDAHVHERR